MFHGVDFGVNYTIAMLKETDPEKKKLLAKKRDFKQRCIALDRELVVGMLVVDRHLRPHTIMKIKGDSIDEKVYYINRPTESKHTLVDITEIYPYHKYLDEEGYPEWFEEDQV